MPCAGRQTSDVVRARPTPSRVGSSLPVRGECVPPALRGQHQLTQHVRLGSGTGSPWSAAGSGADRVEGAPDQRPQDGRRRSASCCTVAMGTGMAVSGAWSGPGASGAGAGHGDRRCRSRRSDGGGGGGGKGLGGLVRRGRARRRTERARPADRRTQGLVPAHRAVPETDLTRDDDGVLGSHRPLPDHLCSAALGRTRPSSSPCLAPGRAGTTSRSSSQTGYRTRANSAGRVSVSAAITMSCGSSTTPTSRTSAGLLREHAYTWQATRWRSWTAGRRSP